MRRPSAEPSRDETRVAPAEIAARPADEAADHVDGKTPRDGRTLERIVPTSRDEVEYRYERKFHLEGMDRRRLFHLIHLHPFCFREIFHERQVNSIYFDDGSFGNYRDNLVGRPDRRKHRVRWYGELCGSIEAWLEIKIRKGLVGSKERTRLAPFELGRRTDWRRFRELVEASDAPEIEKNRIRIMRPVILSAYRRRYFLSADGRFRVTVDWDMASWKFGPLGFASSRPHLLPADLVLELKYHPRDDAFAGDVSAPFPFRMTRHSKYVRAVTRWYG